MNSIQVLVYSSMWFASVQRTQAPRQKPPSLSSLCLPSQPSLMQHTFSYAFIVIRDCYGALGLFVTS